MMKRLLLCSLLSLTLSAPAFSQANQMRRYEINWNIYSFTKHRETNFHGGGLSFAYHLTDHLALVADTSVHTTNVDNRPFGTDLSTYRFGPRFTYKHGNRITTFGHVLAGGARVTNKSVFTFGPATTTTTVSHDGFALAAGGGMDVGIRPWFAFRVIQAEYSFLHFGSLDVNSSGVRLGGGLVFRWGK